MKPKVYLETTIPSYLAARRSRDLLVAAHQELTHEWWQMRRSSFRLFISELVIQEISAGDASVAGQRLEILRDIPILAIDNAIIELARHLIAEGAMPRKAVGDATHIAIASAYGCEYLATWNCRHIANAELQRRMRRIVERYGYELPDLCTPEELMGEE